MLNRHTLAGTALALLSLSTAQAAPIISPFAADLSFAAYSADRAAGGTSAQLAFNGGYWNAGTWGTHWIQADMGSSHTLTEVRFAIDVMPWSSTWQKIYLSDEPIGSNFAALTPVAERAGYTSQYQQFDLLFPAASGRYLQVVTNGGASWTAIGDSGPRSNWVDPGVSPVPEPSSAALLLAGLLGTGCLLRRRRPQA